MGASVLINDRWYKFRDPAMKRHLRQLPKLLRLLRVGRYRRALRFAGRGGGRARGVLDSLDFADVYVECSFVELYADQAFAGEVIAWLRERGFELRGVFNMTDDKAGRAVQADFLFAR